MPNRTGNGSPYRWDTIHPGVPVVMHPVAHARSAAIGIWVRAGGRFEQPSQAGVFHFIEHLVFKGTTTRGCEALKQAIEGVGGELNAFTAEEFTCYWAKVPAAHVDRAIDILADMVLHPALTGRMIEREREVVLEEIRMYEDSPGQHVHDLFNQLLWPRHPLGNRLAGTEETVERLTRATIVRHWRRHYHPGSILIACAGAVEPARVTARLTRAFARSVRRPAPRPGRAPRPASGPVVELFHKDGEQAHVCLGTPALSRWHPLRFALEVLHVLLGGNMSSRLFREVRERRGLAYEIGTQIRRYSDTGAFVVYAGCDPSKVARTLTTVLAELARVRRQPIPERELRRAKEFYRGQLLMTLEDTLEHMLWMGEYALTAGRLTPPEELIRRIDHVRAPDVRQAARQLFAARRLFLAGVGPMKHTETPKLRRLFRTLV